MKTIENNATVTQLWKAELMAANTNRPKENNAKPIAAQPLVLKQQDYDELIQWKQERADKLRGQRRMFFFMGLAVALFAVNLAFQWKFEDTAIVDELVMEKADFEEVLEIPQTQQAPPPPPEQVVQQPVIVEVPDEVILEEVKVNMDVETTEDMVVEEIEFVEEEPEEEVAEEIFLIVEDKPEPVGGMAAFYQYVGDNVKYPRTASLNNVQGRVFVQFVVNSTGQISDVKVVKGIGGGCDEEAARIVQEAPDWNPGKQRGKAVSVRMVLPITFKLANR
ncbi:energy transducer TonB [Reichenbachiella agariperforans]|uniref:energy transducer TonB n=1 Tax=Reichenbachiella agariperforans TaxID=156994 RepID=UPI0020917FA4|nr:energy transducer TonB [Reichenbachiella agariperforans]